MSFNTLIDWNSCSPEQQQALPGHFRLRQHYPHGGRDSG